MGERCVPLDTADVRHAQLIDDALGTQIVKEKSVVSVDKNFSKWCWVDHVNLCQAFFHDRPLARVRTVKTTYEDLPRVAIKRADAVLADEDACEGVLTSFLESATRLSQIFVEGEKDKLTALHVKVEDEVVATLIEAIVVNVSGLV